MQELYVENCTISLKNFKENLGKCKAYSIFMNRMAQYWNVSALILLYRFNTILIKIPKGFFQKKLIKF